MLLLAVSKSLKLSFSSDKVELHASARAARSPMTPTNGTGPRPTRSTPIRASSARTAPTRSASAAGSPMPMCRRTKTSRSAISSCMRLRSTPHAGAQSPQVRTALARYKAADGRLWTTVAPAIEKRPAHLHAREHARRSHDRAAARAFRENRGMRARERGRAGLSSDRRRLRVPATNGSARPALSIATRSRERPRCTLAPRRADDSISPRLEENCEGLGTNEKRLGFVLKRDRLSRRHARPRSSHPRLAFCAQCDGMPDKPRAAAK